jgi:hypothetical protein
MCRILIDHVGQTIEAAPLRVNGLDATSVHEVHLNCDDKRRSAIDLITPRS